MKKSYFVIAGSLLLVIIVILLLVSKFSGQKQNGSAKTTPATTQSPKPNVPSNNPVTITQIKEEGIRIDYYPETKKIEVVIEASSREEYRQRVEKAVKLLKDSGFDTCDPNILWQTPQNIKKELKASDFQLIHDLTCPQGSSATPSAKP